MSLSGYSGTPLGKKLGIKPGHVVWLIGCPDSVHGTLESEIDALYSTEPPEKADVVLLFATSMERFQSEFVKAAPRLVTNGGLWACWPKKASKVVTDITENAIRDFGLAEGLVDNKICAVDETWSGLRFVVRLKDR